jgi:membrane-associated phospholipid phosphatase
MKENFLEKIIEIITKHKIHWSNKNLIFSSIAGISLFSFSLLVNYYASIYATDRAGSSVGDILLSNLPVINVDFIVNDLAIGFFLFVLFLISIEPKRIPFVFKSGALFVLIRSAFIVLTHLGPYPVQTHIGQHDLLRAFNIGGDLFFSGHTGLPFLIALIFWDEKWIRYIFLAASMILGVSVILGHLHYSIDVFAAFFITYSIFHISQKIFKRDYKFFSKKEVC